MSLKKEGYLNRLIDETIMIHLKLFGAISIEGPKWCGKTWTSLNHANSCADLSVKSFRDNARENPKLIYSYKYPQLIDEWQKAPNIWDDVRHECDSDNINGKYILTGSTSLLKEDEEEISHSGTGRISPLKMYTMSLYESKDSTGHVSIMDMYNDKVKEGYEGEIDLRRLAYLIIRGGWPKNLNIDEKYANILPKSYITSILEKDIHERKDKRRDKNKMESLIKSLARNESSMISIKGIINDIEEYESNQKLIKDEETINDYISVLNDLYLIENQSAYGLNYRASARVGKSSKRHLTDPSLACAAINITADKLINDHETFGIYFEALVERDLRIYMNYLNGNLYHFKDNTSGDEVDAILEFENGEYGAVEIKLSANSVESAKKSLMNFYSNVSKKPKFMCIIAGTQISIKKDKETGIYIIPITSLRA